MSDVPTLTEPPGDAPLGRRERKKRETRLALESSALGLFGRQGFEETTVEQITEAADVSLRTFHHYFSSKEEVLFGDYDEIELRFSGSLVAAPAGVRVFDYVKKTVLDLADQYEDQRERHLLRERLGQASPSVERWRLDQLARWEAGLQSFVAVRLGVDSDQDLRPGVFARAVIGALRAVHETWLATGAGSDLKTLLNTAFDQLSEGFSDIS